MMKQDVSGLTMESMLKEYFNADQVIVYQNMEADSIEFRIIRGNAKVEFDISHVSVEELGFQGINTLLETQKKRLDIAASKV